MAACAPAACGRSYGPAGDLASLVIIAPDKLCVILISAISQESEPRMKIHDRTFVVQGARNKIATFVTALQEEETLTDLEMLGILNEVSARVLKYALRAERHPDEPNKPAGLE